MNDTLQVRSLMMRDVDAFTGRWLAVSVACVALCVHVRPALAADGVPAAADCDLVRKADIMNGVQWQRAVAELGGWLSTQTIHTPAQPGGGKPPFSDVPQQRMSIGVGPMGAFIQM